MKFFTGIEYLHTLQNATTVAFDCETTGLQPKFGGLRLLQLAALDRPPVVIDCWELEDEDWIKLENFFSIKRYWLAHNAVFDLGWLQEHELYPHGDVLCTMLASRILTNGLSNVIKVSICSAGYGKLSMVEYFNRIVGGGIVRFQYV